MAASLRPKCPPAPKSVKLEDPTRTISRNHAAISFDQDGTLWIEDYGSLNGTYIIQDDVETKVEHKPMQLEALCTVRIGDQFFQFRQTVRAFVSEDTITLTDCVDDLC